MYLLKGPIKIGKDTLLLRTSPSAQSLAPIFSFPFPTENGELGMGIPYA